MVERGIGLLALSLLPRVQGAHAESDFVDALEKYRDVVGANVDQILGTVPNAIITIGESALCQNDCLVGLFSYVPFSPRPIEL